MKKAGLVLLIFTLFITLLTLKPIDNAYATSVSINIAQGKIATASSEHPTYHAADAVDGDVLNTRWAASDNTKPQWLQVDLGAQYDIARCETYFEFKNGYYQYRIEGSTDGVNWQTFANREQNIVLGDPCYTDEGSINARYVRITVTQTQDSVMWACIWDFKVFTNVNPEFINVAQGKSVSASTEHPAYPAAGAIDGDVTSTRWAASNNTKPQWLQVDLGSQYNIARCETFFEFINGYYQYIIEGSIDGVNWEVFSDKSQNTSFGNPCYTDEGSVNARYVRITITQTQDSVMFACIWDFKVFVMGINSVATQDYITSGNYRLAAESIQGGSGGIGIGIYDTSENSQVKKYGQAKPAILVIKEKNGSSVELEAPYSGVSYANNSLTLWGQVSTVNGSNFLFTDTYQAYDQSGTFMLSRKIEVTTANTLDEGFTSIYSLRPIATENITEYDMFAPGVWYRQNANAVSGAIGSDYSDKYFYIREMRMALPLFSMMNKVTDDSITFCHVNANTSSDITEVNSKWVVDSSLKYASLGVEKTAQPILSFIYPGWEGEANYLDGGETTIKRSHPVQIGIDHSYSILIKVEQENSDFSEKMENTWKYFFDVYSPEDIQLPLDELYNNAIYTLDAYSGEFNGASGFPFRVTIPNGVADAFALDMGFVGQQLPAAYQLIRYGFNNLQQPDNSVNLAQGKKATASSEHPLYLAEYAFDGNTSGTKWASYNNTKPQWLMVDLGKEYSITKTESFFEFPNGYYKYLIESSLDGVNWVIFADRRDNQSLGSPCYTDTGNLNARYVRITVTGTQDSVMWPCIWDFKVYGTNTNFITFGSAIVDFWVNNSMTQCGLPKTWYEPYVNGGTFTNSKVDMRTMSDGMEGALDAWKIMQDNGISKPAWLDYCLKLGNWLVDNQNADGSFYREYDLNGSPVHLGKYNTTNPIKYLVKLYRATSDAKYLTAATKAGEWSYENVHKAFMYVGGTEDNDNTIDREAGVMAMNAFLALYEQLKDIKWLEAYKAAANYAETWVFAWDYNVKSSGTKWASNGSTKPQWLMIDLGQSQTIASCNTYFEFDFLYYAYKIEYSNDSVNWTTYADKSNSTAPGNPCYTDTKNITARYFKITILDTEESGMWPCIREFEIISPEGNNIAKGKIPTVSSFHYSFRPEYATDGYINSVPYGPFPGTSLVGQSLVSTGHSYTDMFMATCADKYYRLYLFTDDTHYLKMAKILQNNSNSTTNIYGNFGYKFIGLVEEGGSVDSFSYNGVGYWLPWCSVAQLDPLSVLEDMFNYMSIDEIETLSLQTRKNLNNNP